MSILGNWKTLNSLSWLHRVCYRSGIRNAEVPQSQAPQSTPYTCPCLCSYLYHCLYPCSWFCSTATFAPSSAPNSALSSTTTLEISAVKVITIICDNIPNLYTIFGIPRCILPSGTFPENFSRKISRLPPPLLICWRSDLPLLENQYQVPSIAKPNTISNLELGAGSLREIPRPGRNWRALMSRLRKIFLYEYPFLTIYKKQ